MGRDDTCLLLEVLFLLFNFYLFIFGCAVFVVALGVSPVVVHWFLTALASLVGEHRL